MLFGSLYAMFSIETSIPIFETYIGVTEKLSPLDKIYFSVLEDKFMTVSFMNSEYDINGVLVSSCNNNFLNLCMCLVLDISNSQRYECFSYVLKPTLGIICISSNLRCQL